MDNYEINILKRNGDWKKINPNGLILDTADQNNLHNKSINSISNDTGVDAENSKQEDFLYCLNKVNLIIGKLESLENQKTDLKNQLKVFKDQFQSKKKNTDEKIKLMSKESEMLDKTISIIKNLKNF